MIISQRSSSSSPGSSSSNSSADLPAFRHEVFLSFYGKDTRLTFTGNLCEALKKTSIITYRDDEDLRQGRFIKPELLQAIESSASAVVVFSPNYAYSKWCLDELAHIVKCKEERGLLVHPVFYHVEPADVRNWRGSFGRAFDEHEGDYGISNERLEAWKSAFRIVGEICGTHVKGDRYEHEVVSAIVTRINRDLQDVLIPRDVITGLVGIGSRVSEVHRILCLQSDDVRFVGIYGMSGTGKTFLASHVYNLIRNQFHCCSFVYMKDVSIETDDFCKLQQRIVNDLIENNSISVSNVMEGVFLLRKHLCGKRFLLVLDDINREGQLEHLAGELSWFGHGSRIIITTTNEHLLKAHRVEDDQKYKCDLLKYDEAQRFFCKKAFGEEHPKKGFEDLTDAILSLAGGLPLALVVFGSTLSGEEDESWWRDRVQMLQKCPDEGITGRLEVCYHRLDRYEQELFIYLACFFRGENYNSICDQLEDIGLHPKNLIEVLRKRSLVTVQSSRVHVHDLLKDMCWEILRKQFPSEPRKRIALNSRQDIVDLMTSKKGGEAIRIIRDEPNFYSEAERVCGHRKAFSKMTRLMLLRIHDVHFPDGIEYLSRELRHLEMNRCSLKSFPPTFEPRHLFKLLMRHSKLEHLWENVIEMPNLEEIDLSESEQLTMIPDLSMTPKLKRLDLKSCTSLVEVHPSVFVHNSLETVILDGCERLESLGSKSIDMGALVYLHLNFCSNLQMIPEFGEKTRQLKSLYLNWTSLKKLPDNLEVEMPNLEHIDLSESEQLTMIPDLSMTPKLKRLHLRNCTSLVEVHPSVFVHNSLRFVTLDGCKRLESLGSKSIDMEALVNLYLSDCSNLQMIPEFGERTRQLKSLYLNGTSLKKLPDNLEEMPNLESINLSELEQLTMIPDLSMNPKLRRLDIQNCTSLVEVHPSVFVHQSLEVVYLSGCKSLESLGSKSIDMNALQQLDLSDCSNLQMIPEFGERTRNLKDLYLDRTRLKKLPDNLGVLRSLSSLSVGETDIQELPSSICQLEKLDDLRVFGCSHLDVSLFMNPQPEIALGFKLNYCNLSGNEFVTISANLCDIVSSARIFEFDCCKNLRALPKLPRSTRVKENELEVDFHYYTSTQELDIPIDRTCIDSSAEYRIISCLNCPRLVENESGGGVAVAILKKLETFLGIYLRLHLR